ncbi:MAG: hypothetical protein H6667_08990 [Ardenticatenaceae bacterium]|nr:hypothetical protein [Ardenticatenaceae bacterium]MCB9445218.1 hypothetical protein [Ardenticatenaceae bacterium]
MDTSNLEKLENLGYFTLPPRHEHCIGYTGLLILMRHDPIARQVTFDPRTIHMRLLDWDGKAHLTTFKNTTPFPLSRIVCPSTITIQDRGGQRATFFVFGGSLEAHDETANEKVYMLRSTAPVLELTTGQITHANQFATEVEALWAELQMSWGMDDEIFWRHLTKVHPFHLYAASLQAVLNHYDQVPDLHTSPHQQALRHTLQLEKTWLQEAGQWPNPTPVLAALRN